MEVKVKRCNGVLKIDIDGKIYDPLSFKSFRPNPQNVSEFYNAGIRLFSVLSTGIICALGTPYSLYGESWIGEREYDFSVIDKQMDMFIENAPDAYFAPMFLVDTREWYLETHPDTPNTFTHLAQALHDEEWKALATEYLQAVIRHCEEKYGDKIYGYFLLGGTTTEWFSRGDREGSHPLKEKGFRRWLGDENAKLPTIERLEQTGDAFLSQEENDVYLARKFHAESIVDLILHFSKIAKEATGRKKLVGMYYGYLFELAWLCYNYGGFAYERIFASQDIDMISSPSAYGYRGIDSSSAFMVTHKTLDSHNKLYFLEFDHITHVAPTMIEVEKPDSKNKSLNMIPGALNKYKDETQSLNVMYRDFILCNSHGTALWWFDMFDGWFRSDGMMRAIKAMIATSNDLMNYEAESVAEVAVFAEGESMYRVRKNAGISSNLSSIRTCMAESGTAYDIYSIMDVGLPQIKHYKVLIFINQYDIKAEHKKVLEEKLQESGKTVVWIYAPNYANCGNCDIKNIEKITKIKVFESSMSHGDVILDGNKMGLDKEDAPYFCVQDENATPVAYFEDGEVAVAYKEIDGVNHVYVATHSINSDILRTIYTIANVFVYSKEKKVYVYPNSSIIGVYNATENDAEIYVKEDGEYMDLIEKTKYKSSNGVLRMPKKDIKAFLLKKVNR